MPAAQRLRNHLTEDDPGCELLSASRAEIGELDDFVDFGDALCDGGTGIRKILMLGSTGEAIAPLELERRQAESLRQRSGKLTPRLQGRLDATEADPDSTLRVKIWTRPAPPAPPRPTVVASLEEAESYRHAVRGARAAFLARDRAELLKALASSPARDVVALDGPPVIEASVTRATLSQLAERADVWGVDLASTEAEAGELRHATYFYDADDDEALEEYTQNGRNGAGVRVGVYEWSNYCGLWHESPSTPAGFSTWTSYESATGPPGRWGCDAAGVQDGDPCNTMCNNGPGFCRGGYCMKEHVTMVASKLGCIRGVERRNASELRMYYGNSGGRAERLAWLASRDVSLVNDSEGGANEPEINWSIRNDMITITHSASNSQSEPVGCHDNAICTGSYSIGSTANIDWWKTDPANREGRYGLSGSTSFIDPPGRWDAEKPDVLGNGEATLMSQVVTPARAEWVSAYGTSFAAPNVGGLVALLQEELPLTTVWPELIRPMVMTAALRHNVLGVSLSRNGAPDERDGAGVPTATTLRQLAAQGTYRTMMLDPSMFDGSNRYLPPGAWFTLQPGETARAVLGWMYCSEAGTNRLSADLDLQLVERSSGTVVDWSTSYTNSLEMIQYTNRGSQPQTYDLRLTHAGFSTCEGVLREYAGLAWAVTGLDLGPSRSLQVTKTADTMDYSCDTDCSLREAIRAANAYPGLDRISVPDGEYQLALGGPAEDLCLTGDLDILDDLELVGTGQAVVIRGDGSDRVFEIRNGARVLISSLTVRDGSSPSATGGGIAVSNGSLEVSDAVVEFNNASRGGGIWNNGGKLVLRRSRVYGNVAGTYGGGIFTEGGSFDAFESSIEGNRANDSGGGIYNSIGFSWLRSSTIASNECEKGGGIRNFDDLQLDDCTVSQNYARLEGGGIWSANGSTAAINYTTLNRNRSSSGSALWTQGVFGLNGSLVEGTCVRFGRAPDYDDENIESPGDTCGLRAGHGITSVPDLMLGNLLPHGGVTKVCPPRPRSPALDPYFLYHPYPGNCPATDQRGAARPTDADGDGNARCESGSVEWVVSELKFTSKSKVEWLVVPGSQRYNTYRGLLSALRSTGGAGSPDYGSCVNHLDPNLTDTALTDTAVPPAGDGYFYLRSATTPIGETPLGWDDDGHERWPAIPCPP